MQPPIVRDNDDFQEQLTLATEIAVSRQTRERHLNYEDGVQAALDWLIGNSDAKPIDPQG